MNIPDDLGPMCGEPVASHYFNGAAERCRCGAWSHAELDQANALFDAKKAAAEQPSAWMTIQVVFTVVGLVFFAFLILGGTCGWTVRAFRCAAGY